MQIKVTSLLALLLLLLCSGAQNQGLDAKSVPHFTQPMYNATIFENSAAKTYLEGPVKMGIYSTDPSWEIRYKIASGDNENLFKAEEYQVGDFTFLRIRTKGGSTAILNREVRDHYLLTVKAVERNSNAEARARVMVQVLDTNDLRPLFSPTSYSVSLPENTAIRTSIAKVTATDADIGTNGEYYYSFREWTDMFGVHPTSGVVTLTGKLDYAETKQYDLEILAVDRGMKLYGSSGFSSMAKLTVRVEQANENAPVITAVTLAPSDTDKDPTYAVVTVEDDDQGANGEIASLSVVAGDPLQQFRAMRTSPGSKEYKIKAVKEVDWESQPYGYNLTLQAKDKGSPPQFSSAKVIHITSPQFKVGPSKFEQPVYRANISEFAPLHTPVVMVTAVPKYPQLKYAFKHKLDKIPFAINSDTGLIVTAGPLHADSLAHYELEVIISNRKAATKVIIDVIDVNNNAPEFQQSSYKASVDENMPVGSSVLTVKATDLDSGENGYVTYSIANINPQPFVIDYFTGVITTLEKLDYELMPRIYNLRIRASDWGQPFRREVEMQVTITLNNLNDNKPLFENVDCQVTVPRDHGTGEQITTVSAIDADELQLVRYVIKAGDDLDLFELNPSSGVLSLKQSLSEGEAAKTSLYSLQIVASDGERETPAMFLNITVITPRKPVQVKCVDTGVATMLAEKLLQGSKIHSQGEPEDNFLDLHAVNRFTPQFTESFPSVVEVKEDLPVGARIVHLSASDSDSGFNGKLVYVISGGDTESRFVVDMNDGWLKVYAPLDRETSDHYTLNVTVYDLGIPQKSSSRLLDVKVTDANDNSPQFLQDTYSVEISENTAVGTEIIQLEAKDRDLGDNGVVRYSILADTDQFSIDEETGVVRVKKVLDREVQAELVLRIAARDQATAEPQLVSTVSLKITLEDVNDNPPKFIPPNYRVKVREDLPIGTVIMWLEAHDPDVGTSSQVRYSLVDSGDGKFEVDKLSGAVRIIQNLDYEKKQVYNLVARAKDKGKPISLSSTCHIEVEVVDVNENLHRPWFPSFVDKGFIKEDVPVGTSVMKVSAQDEDKGRDGEIRYSVRDGSGLGIFAIDEETVVVLSLATGNIQIHSPERQFQPIYLLRSHEPSRKYATSLLVVNSSDSDISGFIHNLESQDIKVEIKKKPDYMSAAPHSAAISVTGSSKGFSYSIAFNSTTVHSLPMAVNVLSNALLRGYNGTGHINTWTKPFDYQIPDSTSYALVYIEAVILGMLAAGMPAYFAMDHTRDREIKCRSTLRISGLVPSAYWCGQASIDIPFYYLILICMTCTLFAFHSTDLLSNSNVLAVIICLIGFCPATILFTYCVSFMFAKVQSNRDFFSVVSMMVCVVSASIVQLVFVNDNPGLSRFLHNVLCFFNPLYPLMGCLNCITKATFLRPFHEEFLWKNLLIAVIAPYFQCVLLLFLLRWLEIRYGGQAMKHDQLCRISCKTKGKVQRNPEENGNEDEDVLMEKARVKEALTCQCCEEKPVVVVSNLRKEYLVKKVGFSLSKKRKVAAKSISFCVRKGEVLGLLGPNGAGKSTIMHMLSGDTTSNAGQILMGDYGTDFRPVDKTLEHVGYCPQVNPLWPRITLQEHLQIYAAVKGLRNNDALNIIKRVVNALELKEHLHKQAKSLSAGLKRKLCFALSMLGNPQIVLLDEPSSGMDPKSKQRMWRAMRVAFKNKQRGAILTTHYMEEAEAVCDRVAIMVSGQLRCIGSIQHLKGKYGQGYSLEIKLREALTGLQQVALLHKEILRIFPHAARQESFATLMVYKIPMEDVKSLAKAFSQLESAKQNFNFEEYNFSQSTLEQVFLEFAKEQENEEEEVGSLSTTFQWQRLPQDGTASVNHSDSIVHQL